MKTTKCEGKVFWDGEHDLRNYETGKYIREATFAELAESLEAAKTDGGAGVITVEIDGESIRCYVQD